jgi:hypothetical protein
VEAICKIGRSTKAGLGNETRYIGEKGIGFKSVFKVSDVVWITSGHYSFKFDKQEKLGMIAPIWEQFPEPRLRGYTSMLLQLSNDYNPTELIMEIRLLDPKLLIFLRKLRQINIRSYDGNGIFLERSLGRNETSAETDSLSIVNLQTRTRTSSASLWFKTTRFPVVHLPTDPKRPGSTQSEILLAFPISSSGNPKVESQNVHAFLPIRDYGFKVSTKVLAQIYADLADVYKVSDPSGLHPYCKSRRCRFFITMESKPTKIHSKGVFGCCQEDEQGEVALFLDAIPS